MSMVILALVCISLVLGLMNLIGIALILDRIQETEWSLRDKMTAVRDQIVRALQ